MCPGVDILRRNLCGRFTKITFLGKIAVPSYIQLYVSLCVFSTTVSTTVSVVHYFSGKKLYPSLPLTLS